MGADWRGGDGTSMRFRVPEFVVNIAHFPEFNPEKETVSARPALGLFLTRRPRCYSQGVRCIKTVV